jgi:endonuclease/exonuclease/phosphatase (EEP) superfamily protein YafD
MRILATGLIWLAVLVAAIATILGLLAPWWPPLEMVNHFRPLILLVAAALVAMAIVLRNRPLGTAAAALTLLTLGLGGAPLLHAAAPASEAPRFLRIATFNVNWENRQFPQVVQYLSGTDADVIVLQEVRCSTAAQLIDPLRPVYPHVFGAPASCVGQAILSKQPWTTVGRLADRRGDTMMLWARFRHGAMSYEVGGLHLAFPFRPDRQAEHVDRLIGELSSRPGPRILAGDFNLTPFSYKLGKLAHAAGLRRHGTFLASWPSDFAMPALLIDNVLSTPDFTSVAMRVGPDLGSDHRPVIADIALARP